MGRDVEIGGDTTQLDNFNSHARVGRDLYVPTLRTAKLYFNSHARVGRDKFSGFIQKNGKISTHTPAWGVT